VRRRESFKLKGEKSEAPSRDGGHGYLQISSIVDPPFPPMMLQCDMKKVWNHTSDRGKMLRRKEVSIIGQKPAQMQGRCVVEVSVRASPDLPVPRFRA